MCVTCLALGGLHNICIFLGKFLDQRVDEVVLQEELWKCLSHGKFERQTHLVKDKLDGPCWELSGNKRQHTLLFRSFLHLMLLFAEGDMFLKMCLYSEGL
jgi:hypothetical protein